MVDSGEHEHWQRRAQAPRLEYGEVRPILEELVAAGKPKPSAVDLFAKLQRGSMMTLQKFVDRFREEQQREKESEQFKFSAEDEEFFEKAASQYKSQLKTRFVAIARSRIESEQQSLQADLEELRQAKAMFMAECERLDARMKEDSERHEAEVIRLTSRIAVLEPMEDRLKTALSELGLAGQARAVAEARNEQLEEESKQTKTELEDCREKLQISEHRRLAAEAEAEAAASGLLKANEALRERQDEIIRLNVQLESVPRLDAMVRKLEEENRALRSEASVSAERNKAVAERLDELQKSYRDKLSQIEDENRALKKSIEEDRSLLQKHQQASILAEEKVRHAEARLKEFQEQSDSRQSLLEASIRDARSQMELLLKNAEADRKTIDAILKKRE